MQIPRFDLTPNADIGKLFFMGEDERGDQVYIIGLGAGHRSLSHLVDSYLQLLGMTAADYRLVNCLSCVNLPTRIGGYSSRSLGLVWFGRRVAAWGVQHSFHNYLRLVQRVQQSTAQLPAFLD